MKKLFYVFFQLLSIYQMNNEQEQKQFNLMVSDPLEKYCISLEDIFTKGIEVYPKLKAIDLLYFGNKLVQIDGEEKIAESGIQTIYKIQTKMSRDDTMSSPLLIKQLKFQSIDENQKKQINEAAAFYNKIADIEGTIDFAGCFHRKNRLQHTIYYFIHEYFDQNIDQMKQINNQPNILNIHNQLTQTLQRIKFYQKLFQIVANLRAQGIIHNDIKPSNIYLRNTNYRGQIFLAGFQFMQTEATNIFYTTPCYEHIFKKHINYSTFQLDVFSMAIVIIELEAGPENLCQKFNENYPDYKSINVTDDQVNFFYQLVQQAMQAQDFTPRKNDSNEVQEINQCDNLRCILIYCIQPDVSKIPEAYQVVQAFNNIAQS